MKRICERLLITLPRRVLKHTVLQMKSRLAVPEAPQSGAVIRIRRTSDTDCRAMCWLKATSRLLLHGSNHHHHHHQTAAASQPRAQTRWRFLDRCFAERFQPGLVRYQLAAPTATCERHRAPCGPSVTFTADVITYVITESCPFRPQVLPPPQKRLSDGFICPISCQRISKMDVCFVSLICHLHVLEPCLRPHGWITDAKLANFAAKQQIFMPRPTHPAANVVISIWSSEALLLIQLASFLEAILI